MTDILQSKYHDQERKALLFLHKLKRIPTNVAGLLVYNWNQKTIGKSPLTPFYLNNNIFFLRGFTIPYCITYKGVLLFFLDF